MSGCFRNGLPTFAIKGLTRSVNPLSPLPRLRFCLIFFLVARLSSIGADAPTHGAVATVQGLATDAAVAAMKHGGNAIDGAVAAALTLGVVDGFNSGLGGGCLMLIRTADGATVAVDGRETAAGTATREMFLRQGRANSFLSQTGALAVATPGALAAYDYAVRKFGRLPLSVPLQAAARLAEDGFVIDKNYARRIADSAADLRRSPAALEIFFEANGKPRRSGEVLKQTDLARSYRQIAEHGIDWFYRGSFSAAADRWMKMNNGILRSADFRGYEVKIRQPVHTTYRGHEIIGFPPPSSGGVHVAQILNILESFDLKAMGPESADFVHIVAESMKLAFADRAYWLGDPDFADVPLGLVSKEYATSLARKIQRDRVTPVSSHGPANASPGANFGKHTTHFSVADGEGNWVACTATINTTFGSKVILPGTGIVLNNEMDDFSAEPGVANYFGLIGAEANAIAPGKRPLSSMSPTFVLLDGKPVAALGASGGPTIISQTVLAIIGVVDFGMDLEAALRQPRFHHQWSPDVLKMEKGWSAKVRRELEKRGHKLVVIDSMASTQSVGKTHAGFSAVHDPRNNGKSAQW